MAHTMAVCGVWSSPVELHWELTRVGMGYVLAMMGKVKVWVYPFLDFWGAELALKQKLSLPVSRMWQ
jgi:hypothetical protein